MWTTQYYVAGHQFGTSAFDDGSACSIIEEIVHCYIVTALLLTQAGRWSYRDLNFFLERPLDSIVCLLHLNELLFCHLFDAIDGGTTGPTMFASEIGKQIKKNFHQLLPVTFQ